MPREFFEVNIFLLIYYEQRYTVRYLNANLERRCVTSGVVVCAVGGKYLDG